MNRNPRQLEEARTTLVLCAIRDTIDVFRIKERDPHDVFDHSGALAAHLYYTEMLGRSVEDHIACIEARRVALSDGLAVMLDGFSKTLGAEGVEASALEAAEATMRRACDLAVLRAVYATHVSAAWARDGFRTYEVARGLWDVVKDMSDAGSAAAPGDTRFPVPTFAIRFPGPDYPTLHDARWEYEVRGVLVAQYDDAVTPAHLMKMDSAIIAALDSDGDTYEAGVAALGENTTPALSVLIPGYIASKGGSLGCAIEHTLARWRYNRGLTMREVVEKEVKIATTPDDSGGEDELAESNIPAYRMISNVVAGVGLWLTHSGDEGEPIRARPVHLPDGKRCTPDARVLGRGVKSVLP